MNLATQDAVDLGREVARDGRLKALRERLGLTRNAMAELLQTAWPTYANWESGTRRAPDEDRRPVTLHAAFFVHGVRIYQAAAIGETLPEDAVRSFFGAIKLTP